MAVAELWYLSIPRNYIGHLFWTQFAVPIGFHNFRTGTRCNEYCANVYVSFFRIFEPCCVADR